MQGSRATATKLLEDIFYLSHTTLECWGTPIIHVGPLAITLQRRSLALVTLTACLIYI